MNTFIGYDKGTVEKSTGHSYIFFIADEVIGIPPLFIPFWPCREQGLFLLQIYKNKNKVTIQSQMAERQKHDTTAITVCDCSRRLRINESGSSKAVYFSA